MPVSFNAVRGIQLEPTLLDMYYLKDLNLQFDYYHCRKVLT